MKNILIIFLFMLVGSLTAFSQGDNRRRTAEERADMLTARMEKELSLSAAQLEKVKSINLASAKKSDTAREQAGQEREKFREQRAAIEEERNSELKLVLTQEQFAKYQEMLKEQYQKRGDKGSKRTNS